MAGYDEARIHALLLDARIVRNRQKVRSAVRNAGAFLKVQEEYGSFDAYIWRFVDGKPIQNAWGGMGDIPAVTDLAGVISKNLKARGFNFVGPTICYAYMQTIGMVNDHATYCFRYTELGGGGWPPPTLCWALAPPVSPRYALWDINPGGNPVAKRPNFVVFLTDDQGYGDLSCMGATDFRTPTWTAWPRGRALYRLVL